MNFLIILFAISFIAHDPMGLTITEKKVVLIINEDTTEEQLKNYKQELWEKKGISFDVQKIARDRSGKIAEIAILVDCHDGFNGSAGYQLTGGRRIGFYRIYDAGVDTGFGIGNIDE